MTFFESLLLLLLAAIALLQVARRLSLPYPAMLAGAGVIVALIPGAPSIPIEPSTYLALFIVPAVVDAAYDFPPGATRRFFGPLIAFAVVAVILTIAIVAWRLRPGIRPRNEARRLDMMRAAEMPFPETAPIATDCSLALHGKASAPVSNLAVVVRFYASAES